MKKIKVMLIALSLLVLSAFIPMRATAIDLSMPPIEPKAQYMDILGDIKSTFGGIIDVIKNGNTELESIFDKLGDIYDWLTKDSGDILTGMLQEWSEQMTKTIASMFQLVSNTLDGTSNISIIGNKAYTKSINTILGYIAVTAGTLSGIFWGIGQVRTAIHYEEWTEKKIAIAILTIVISTTIITNSAKVCLWIYNLENSLVSNILNSGGGDFIKQIEKVKFQDDWLGSSSGIPLVGVIVDMFMSFLTLVPFGLCIIFLLIMVILVYVKLILRELEIACMTCISPIFFGCWVSDVTRPYFKNFLATFFSVVFETVFMAITLVLGVQLLANQLKTGGAASGSYEMWNACKIMVMAGAIMTMCFKPPQILTNLVRA